MSRFRSRFGADDGDGVLVFFVVSSILLALVIWFVVSVAMGTTVKNNIYEATQDAADSAITKIRSNGTLGYDSVEKFVEAANRNIGELQSRQAIPHSSACDTVVVDGVKYRSPYYEIYLREGRGVGAGANSTGKVWSWVYKDGKLLGSSFVPNDAKTRVLEAKLYVATPDILTGNCEQKSTIGSAIAFGSRGDLR